MEKTLKFKQGLFFSLCFLGLCYACYFVAGQVLQLEYWVLSLIIPFYLFRKVALKLDDKKETPHNVIAFPEKKNSTQGEKRYIVYKEPYKVLEITVSKETECFYYAEDGKRYKKSGTQKYDVCSEEDLEES